MTNSFMAPGVCPRANCWKHAAVLTHGANYTRGQVQVWCYGPLAVCHAVPVTSENCKVSVGHNDDDLLNKEQPVHRKVTL